MTFGERLRAERKRLGLNQTDFAALGGIVKFTQLTYEKGDSTPNLDYLRKLHDAGVDAYYILTGERAAAPSTDTVVPLSQRLDALLASEQDKGTPDAVLVHELLSLATKLSAKAVKASN